MFTEVLRLKPILDPASTATMERNLNSRFSRVAKRFGTGIKSLMRGAIFGVSLALLNKLLNPLNDLEEKVKRIIGQGDDIRDLADKFNTSPGNLKRLQDVAASLGLEPEKLNEMLDHFAKAIDDATKPLKIGEERSSQAIAVQNFAGEKDLAEGFFSFIQQLKGLDAKQRQLVEKEVFGDELFGAKRRFVEADFAKQFAAIGNPSTQRLTQDINRLADLALLQKTIQTRNETRDMSLAANQMNAQMIRDMEESARKRSERDTKQLQSFSDLEKAAQGIEVIKQGLVDLSAVVTKGAGYLGDLLGKFQKLESSKLLRGIWANPGGKD